MREKMAYQAPQLEIVEFEVEEAIAQSANGRSFFGTLGSGGQCGNDF